jgi:imidazoleglycerol phosphate synthase glutamine amidotransferase subunit HisH
MQASEVAVVDSGGANLASLAYALERLGVRAHVTADARAIASAPRVILPGVGSARDAMQRLRSAGLTECLPQLKQPVLGICLGMQLLFRESEEGPTECLGILPESIRRLCPTPGLPVPHMGWNQLQRLSDDHCSMASDPTRTCISSTVMPLRSQARPVRASIMAGRSPPSFATPISGAPSFTPNARRAPVPACLRIS